MVYYRQRSKSIDREGGFLKLWSSYAVVSLHLPIVSVGISKYGSELGRNDFGEQSAGTRATYNPV
jgi:hypothetical protein